MWHLRHIPAIFFNTGCPLWIDGTKRITSTAFTMFTHQYIMPQNIAPNILKFRGKLLHFSKSPLWSFLILLVGIAWNQLPKSYNNKGNPFKNFYKMYTCFDFRAKVWRDIFLMWKISIAFVVSFIHMWHPVAFKVPIYVRSYIIAI